MDIAKMLLADIESLEEKIIKKLDSPRSIDPITRNLIDPGEFNIWGDSGDYWLIHMDLRLIDQG